MKKKKKQQLKDGVGNWLLTIVSFILIAFPLIITPFNPSEINNWYDPEYPSRGNWLFYLVVFGPLGAGLVINILFEKTEGKNLYLSVIKYLLIGTVIFILFFFANMALYYSWG